MSVSVRIFGGPLTGYATLARAAEDAGFERIWVPDHVVAMSDVATVYPYSDTGRPRFVGETPFGDPLVLLSHLAAATTTIQFGVGVYVLPLRHPLHAARQLLTLQELSGGRLTLGVGVGWKQEEFVALGAEFGRRGARAEEAVAAMRAVWSGDPVAFDGDHHAFAELQMSPPLSHPIPVLWGGSGEVSVRRAVRMCEGFYGPPGTPEATAQLAARIDEELDRVGRERSTFRLVARCPEPYRADGVLGLLDLGVDEVVVNLPRDLDEAGEQIEWLHATTAGLREAGVPLSPQEGPSQPARP